MATAKKPKFVYHYGIFNTEELTVVALSKVEENGAKVISVVRQNAMNYYVVFYRVSAAHDKKLLRIMDNLTKTARGGY